MGKFGFRMIVSFQGLSASVQIEANCVRMHLYVGARGITGGELKVQYCTALIPFQRKVFLSRGYKGNICSCAQY